MTSTRGMDKCDCYECVGPKYADDGETILNNMKYHTLGEPCEECGREKSEYLDLGRKGYYVCWWCNSRSRDAGSDRSEGDASE